MVLKWNAPDAIKRIWSVFTIPYLVLTVEPSTIGNKSRWTPSRETSGPFLIYRHPQFLSISVYKNYSASCTRLIASCRDWIHINQLLRFFLCNQFTWASFIGFFLFFFFLGIILLTISWNINTHIISTERSENLYTNLRCNCVKLNHFIVELVFCAIFSHPFACFFVTDFFVFCFRCYRL